MDKEQKLDNKITLGDVLRPIGETIDKESCEYSYTDTLAKRALNNHYGNITTLDFVQQYAEMANKDEIIRHLKEIDGIGNMIASMLEDIISSYKKAAILAQTLINEDGAVIHDSGWSNPHKEVMANVYSEIISWLYRNHESFESAVEWRQEFTEFLAQLLLHTD